MAIGFNTGRLYQADGQRISVGLCSHGDYILFNDHSRGVSGALDLTPTKEGWGTAEQNTATYRRYLEKDAKGELDKDDLVQFATMVMRRYDHNRYTYHSEANRIKAEKWPTVRCTNN
jgi:hypothetical protein